MSASGNAGKAAVLFLVFSRPNQTSAVFEAIRAARPARLYVAADGPRADRIGELDRCEKVRQIATGVDWPCQVYTRFRDSNLGCKRAVSDALDWFFGEEEAGIVLEDDCLPHPDFFLFCDALLARYAEDARVSVITGDNFQRGRRRGDASYYFSKYNHCWGWASWRRAWRLYDGELHFWPEWQGSAAWRDRLPNARERRYWQAIFDRVARGEIDSWAYPWTASVWYRGGLTATPNVNLVTNIGFSDEATHTRGSGRGCMFPHHALGSLVHPNEVKQDLRADDFVFAHHFCGRLGRLSLAGSKAMSALVNLLPRRGDVDRG
ncbi:glycosyltransferase family 2 protein [Thiorhodococcus minor]|uniref:Glycosyltransferase family 2 protein n=1 Tax=Thiorhodococcus minor TaxID=57489 RepID=A0A6M0K321_9GAMM|nr:glycosyltransferase family 2 protein [Thiorhodococcus minor]NEV63007.1 glycosyltransferase family 2 protein [Thiorhodococcus minor]